MTVPRPDRADELPNHDYWLLDSSHLNIVHFTETEARYTDESAQAAVAASRRRLMAKDDVW